MVICILVESVQVLNALAPAQMAAGDASGAENMLTSSFTLAKNLRDLPAQVRAHAGTCTLGSESQARQQNLQCSRVMQIILVFQTMHMLFGCYVLLMLCQSLTSH